MAQQGWCCGDKRFVIYHFMKGELIYPLTLFTHPLQASCACCTGITEAVKRAVKGLDGWTDEQKTFFAHDLRLRMVDWKVVNTR